MYLSIFNSFRVITMLKLMRKSKNRYFYHIFVSPRDAPAAITLNVVWMEREFDAYKLPRCMCPCNRFWDRARYWSKIVIFSYPLPFDAPIRRVPVAIAPPRLVWKTRMAWLPDDEKITKISFIRFGATHERDGQTDRHRVTAYIALMHTHRAVKTVSMDGQ